MPEDDDIITMMRTFKRDLLRREARQMREMSRAWVDVERSLSASLDALILDLAERQRNGGDISQGALFRMRRYQDLLTQVQGQIDQYATYAEGEITSGQKLFGEMALEHAAENISAAAGISFNRLPVEAVELMAGSLANGSPLNLLLLNNSVRGDSIARMTSTLINNTARGVNPRKTARAMKDDLAGGLSQALTVTRTEQMRVYREMTEQQYRASGVVEGKYRLTARDARVCMACLVRDGEFIPLGQEMDEHPNGRCTSVAAIIGRPAPQWLKGPQWLQGLGEAQQRQMMGAGRYDAWRNGQFELSELAVTVPAGRFGSSLQVAPLRNFN